MTETEWHCLSDPGLLLAWLEESLVWNRPGRPGPRRRGLRHLLRLYCCAVWLQGPRWERDAATQRVLRYVQRLEDTLHADNLQPLKQALEATHGRKYPVFLHWMEQQPLWAARHLHATLQRDGMGPSDEIACDFLRDILGNPFAPVCGDARGGYFRQLPNHGGREFPLLSADVLTWENGQIPRLARAIGQEKRWQDLPVLADALEEAGCTDRSLLDFLRNQERCWRCGGSGRTTAQKQGVSQPRNYACGYCTGSGWRRSQPSPQCWALRVCQGTHRDLFDLRLQLPWHNLAQLEALAGRSHPAGQS